MSPRPKQPTNSGKRPQPPHLAKANAARAAAGPSRPKGQGHKDGRKGSGGNVPEEQRKGPGGLPKDHPTLEFLRRLPSPDEVETRPGRTRGEIRVSVSKSFDAAARARMDQALRDPDTPLKDIIAIGDLFARIGVGFIGANELDPADVAKLPPPVFATLDPNAPLPDGKPE